jgi:hypothetical protein
LKSVALVAVPSAFRTLIGPSVPLLGTVAVIVVSFSTLNVPALWPSKSTSVTAGLLKFVPVIVTVVPTGPLVGLNDASVGSAAWAGVTPNKPSTMAVSTRMAEILVASLRIGLRIGQSPLPSGPCLCNLARGHA